MSIVALFGLAYFVGIVVDETYETLLEPWTARIIASALRKGVPEPWDMQAYVLTYSGDKTTQLSYMRSRLRILRASVINVPLISIVALAFILRQTPATSGQKAGLALFFVISGLVLTGLTILTYQRITRSYWLGVQSIYGHLRGKESSQD